MKNILFVDDEINILNGFRRMLHSKKNEWHIVFVQSGVQALEILEDTVFDVVVSDMLMPSMDGVTLLNIIKVKYPRTTRIALSGYCDNEMILDSIKATHLFISKPTDFKTLSCSIERCLSIKLLVDDKNLCDFISGISSIPSLPEIYNQLVEELTFKEASIHSVGEIIQQDVGMSVKLLQIVNSAYFGLAREILSPSEAVAHLGINIIKSLVLSIKVFEAIGDELTAEKSNKIFSRSRAVGQLAVKISKSEGFDQQQCDEIMTACLLQDIGKLMIHKYYPKVLQAAFDESVTADLKLEIELERKIFGVSHEKISAYLLHLWGIPFAVVECVAYHHGREEEINFEKLSSLDVIYLSNLIISQGDSQLLTDTVVNNCDLQKFFKKWKPSQ